MHDDELKALWRAREITPAPSLPDATQLTAMKTRMDRMNRTLFLRDYREGIAAVFVMVVFGFYFFKFPTPLSRLGCVLVILAGVLVMAYPVWRRRRVPQASPDESMMQSLQSELRKVEVEIALLRSVLWWYILPLSAGGIVFFVGLNLPLPATLLFTFFGIALDAFIHWLNQVACDKSLVPLKCELESLLRIDETLPPTEPPRRYLTSIIVMLISILLGIFSLLAKTDEKEILRAPAFNDISAFTATDKARIDAWLQEQIALAQYPSLSAAIVSGGKIVYQAAFGFEDIEAGRKATPETSYHVASVTKIFTTSMAVMLHARGVIDLDQPAAKYLPKDVSISRNPQLGATVTLRQLASHTSGLPRGIPGPVQSIEDRYQLEPQRLYDLLAKVKLESDPGAAERYSNLGMGLLGHILERAAGKPYDQLLQEMICAPLHLERTAIQPNDKFHIATGYSGNNPRRQTEHDFRKRLAPSGGLIASAPDLAQFLLAQLKPGHFTAEMLKQLHTPPNSRTVPQRTPPSAGPSESAPSWAATSKKTAVARTAAPGSVSNPTTRSASSSSSTAAARTSTPSAAGSWNDPFGAVSDPQRS